MLWCGRGHHCRHPRKPAAAATLVPALAVGQDLRALVARGLVAGGVGACGHLGVGRPRLLDAGRGADDPRGDALLQLLELEAAVAGFHVPLLSPAAREQAVKGTGYYAPHERMTARSGRPPAARACSPSLDKRDAAREAPRYLCRATYSVP